jgi:hypothetical protein
MKMKNKKQAEQIAAKQKHRRSKPNLERRSAYRIVKPTILIVCEGKNTEPSYFKQFRLSSAKVKSIGEGYNTTSLVERAYELSQLGNYDQVWCVFDADPKPDNPNQEQNFNEAIKMAEKNNFGIAYSNQAFEYWLILHFDDHQGARMHRNRYNEKLNKLLKPFKVEYDGNGSKVVEEDLFELLEGIDKKTNLRRVDIAIVRAERNYNRFDHTNPAKEESSTTVFRLVKELLEYV